MNEAGLRRVVGLAPASLAAALAPDGTPRPGATGSFDARHFAMSTAPDGHPVFRPADTQGADDFRWANGFSLPNGTDGTISAVVQAGTAIYIGGTFSTVGTILANNVAKWDGTAWSSLGTGPANGVTASNYSVVNALAVAPGGEVYVGGRFIQAGGLAANYIAKWNGTA